MWSVNQQNNVLDRNREKAEALCKSLIRQDGYAELLDYLEATLAPCVRTNDILTKEEAYEEYLKVLTLTQIIEEISFLAQGVEFNE